MNFDLELFLRALGLAFVLEGIAWFAFPNGMRTIMSKMLEMPEKELRSSGFIGIAIGLGIIFLASF